MQCSPVVTRRTHRWAPLALFTLAAAGCGGAPKPAEPPNAEAESAQAAPTGEPVRVAATEPSAAAPVEAALPTGCHGDEGLCLPDPRWVKRLCNDVYPNVALVMFSGGSPWTRGYLTRKTKAWNASGGATSGDEWVAFDEEVILLYARGNSAGGMQVSGATGGYEALRWDGSCVTLSGDEVTTNEPPKPKHGRVDWRFLEPDVREALRKDDAVTDAYRARRSECKGAFSGEVSNQCLKADQVLVDSIVAAVGRGIELPVPEKLP